MDEETTNKIKALPFKVKIIKWLGQEVKEINYDYYSMDEKTVLRFNRIWGLKSFTIPNNVEKIAEEAFYFGANLEKITIPVTCLI